MDDQNGTVHQYDYDLLGRPTQDRVTTLGTGIEGERRVEVTYEVRGLAEHVTVYDNASVGSGSIAKDTLFAYNDFAQLITEYQSRVGAVNISTTPKVQYAYADGSSNTVRPTSLTYPNGRVITYDYGSAGGTDDEASRVQAIKESSTSLAAYEYLGLGIPVEVDYTEPDVRYLLYDSGSSDNIYTGLDRFGRIVDNRWEDYGSSTDAARIGYGYDRASNRTYRENTVDTTDSFDEFYNYDDLHRLKHTDRGALNAGKTGIGTLKFAQCWTLDETGNWKNLRQDDDGNGIWDLVQQRTSNVVNEITGITETTGPIWADPAYDANGNMTTVPQPADPTTTYTAVYDAWNRVLKLKDGAVTKQENEYDGLGRRVVHKDGSTTRNYYYSASWQLLETRDSAAVNTLDQHVWGLRYINDLILRDRDTSPAGSSSSSGGGTLDERLYALQDANWNVTAVIDETGTVLERYAYDSYGAPIFLTPTFGSRTASDYDWETLYAGYRWDTEVELYHVRYRVFHPLLGTWLQRDPISFASGMNLYEYTNSHPLNEIDPSGLGDGDWIWPAEGNASGMVWDIDGKAYELSPSLSAEWKSITSRSPWATFWNRLIPIRRDIGDFQAEIKRRARRFQLQLECVRNQDMNPIDYERQMSAANQEKVLRDFDRLMRGVGTATVAAPVARGAAALGRQGLQLSWFTVNWNFGPFALAS